MQKNQCYYGSGSISVQCLSHQRVSCLFSIICNKYCFISVSSVAFRTDKLSKEFSIGDDKIHAELFLLKLVYVVTSEH